jgi:multisubunit Na+/H+ antiporter MnhC subunit
LFLLVELRQKGLKNASAKMMMSVSIVEHGFLVMAIIVGYEARSTHFPLEHRAEYLARTIRRILDFLQL